MSFPLIKTQVLSDSELYLMGKVFLEKLLQNVIFDQSNFSEF